VDCDTADVPGIALDLARVDTRPDRQALGCRTIPDRARALNGTRREVDLELDPASSFS
jgi:hypothetical protein